MLVWLCLSSNLHAFPQALRAQLQELVAQAFVSRASLLAERSLTEQAEHQMRLAGTQKGVTLSSAFSVTHVGNVARLASITIPSEPTPLVIPGQAMSDDQIFDLDLQLSKLLYSAGQVEASYLEAAWALKAQRAQERQARENTAREVAESYFELYRAQRLEELRSRQLAQARHHLERAQRRRELGVAAGHEVELAQAQMDAAARQAEAAAALREMQEANLARSVGRSVHPVLVAVDPQTIPEPLPAALEERIGEQALKRRADLAAMQFRLQALRAHERVEWARGGPNVSVGGELSLNRGDTTPARIRTRWNLNLSVRYTLYDAGQRREAVRSALSQTEAVARQKEEMQRQVRFQIATAIRDLQAQHASLRAKEAALAQQRLQLRIAERQAELGMKDLSGLLDQTTSVFAAEVDLELARVDVLLSYVRLLHAAGVLTEFLEGKDEGLLPAGAVEQQERGPAHGG